MPSLSQAAQYHSMAESSSTSCTCLDDVLQRPLMRKPSMFGWSSQPSSRPGASAA